jgi:hypothetical protein
MTPTVHTEAEAANQECPQKLVHPGIPGSARRCVGSGCMAWRWSDLPGEPKGYCGLAGTPAPRSSRNT